MKQGQLAIILDKHARLLKEADNTGIDISTIVIKNLIKECTLGEEFPVWDNHQYKHNYFPVLTVLEVETGKNEGKLPAIKNYRDRTKLSLMDSKRAVECYFDVMGYKFK
jgi:ribosomal protein L7/L12